MSYETKEVMVSARRAFIVCEACKTSQDIGAAVEQPKGGWGCQPLPPGWNSVTTKAQENYYPRHVCPVCVAGMFR